MEIGVLHNCIVYNGLITRINSFQVCE